jgi:hypothetical protein
VEGALLANRADKVSSKLQGQNGTTKAAPTNDLNTNVGMQRGGTKDL